MRRRGGSCLTRNSSRRYMQRSTCIRSLSRSVRACSLLVQPGDIYAVPLPLSAPLSPPPQAQPTSPASASSRLAPSIPLSASPRQISGEAPSPRPTSIAPDDLKPSVALQEEPRSSSTPSARPPSDHVHQISTSQRSPPVMNGAHQRSTPPTPKSKAASPPTALPTRSVSAFVLRTFRPARIHL